MFEVFDDMTDADWDHALGGLHALAFREGRLIGHASVVQRQLLHQGRALRCGYVEAVGVHPSFQRQGVGGQLMAPLERAILSAYDLGALGATDDAAAFYARRGWKKWRGPSSALTPAGLVRTPEEDDCIFVFEGQTSLDLEGELTCDFREGDVW